jgi:hypothetical protein
VTNGWTAQHSTVKDAAPFSNRPGITVSTIQTGARATKPTARTHTKWSLSPIPSNIVEIGKYVWEKAWKPHVNKYYHIYAAQRYNTMLTLMPYVSTLEDAMWLLNGFRTRIEGGTGYSMDSFITSWNDIVNRSRHVEENLGDNQYDLGIDPEDHDSNSTANAIATGLYSIANDWDNAKSTTTNATQSALKHSTRAWKMISTVLDLKYYANNDTQYENNRDTYNIISFAKKEEMYWPHAQHLDFIRGAWTSYDRNTRWETHHAP